MSKFHDSGLRQVGNSVLFNSLDDEVLQRLAVDASHLTFREGHLVVREGDPGEAMYVITEGQVRVYTTRGGHEIQLNILGPGACFGEVALLTGRPRTATVVTLSPCSVICFTKRQIDNVLEAFPKVKVRLESLVLGRARDTIDKITRPV